MGKLLHVAVVADDLESNPHCPHGPTLRFRRITEDGQRDYFACSACRDRKDCNFHHWCDQRITEAKLLAWELERARTLPSVDHSQLLAKLAQARQQRQRDRVYCHTCLVLVLPGEFSSHSTHDVTTGVTSRQLSHPSELLKPLQSSKKEAQFLFSEQAAGTIVSILVGCGVRHVVCVGAPRVHEHIQSRPGADGMSSLLLDIDHRYHQFFSRKQFCWYNCFNHHFFSGEPSHKVLARFLKKNKGEGIALVTDPPFGGRVEYLTRTINHISSLHRTLNPAGASAVSVMWIFPYFMESQILASFPDYHMSDYKVNYENHPLFTQGPKSRKFGSPIRIFTNISPEKVVLPTEEGYRYCGVCERWVSLENKHCSQCGWCTSKNGQTYVHCSLCKRCVKPSWQHCATCNRCSLASHDCEQFVTRGRCFTCNMDDHKSKNCPLKVAKFEVEEVKRRGKRSRGFGDEQPTKKHKATPSGEELKSSRKKLKNSAPKKTMLTVPRKAQLSKRRKNRNVMRKNAK